MHVLYIFGFQYSLKIWKNSGAIEREFEFFRLMGQRFNTKYTLFTYGDQSDFDYELPYNVEVIPIYKRKKITFLKFYDVFYSVIIPFKIYKKLKNIDLIKTNQLHGSWVAILFKFLLKKPLFVRTGYDAMLFSKHQAKNRIKQFIFYLQTYLSLKFCQIYSVTSFSDKKFLEKLFKHNDFTKKIVLRPNWVKNSESSIGFFQKNKDFIAVGRLENQKNYHFLISNFLGIEKKLSIVGEGSQKQELKNLISKLNLNIEIHDNINYNNLLKTLTNYKFFILASKYEGNPKVLLEAMSVGCIPIVSDIPNNTEIVTHKKNGFVFSLETKNSLNTTLKTISNFKNLNIISNNAKQYVTLNNSLTEAINMENKDFKKILVDKNNAET